MKPLHHFPLFCLLLACPATPAISESVYQWTDDEGVTHYSKQPPKNTYDNSPAKRKKIPGTKSDSILASGRLEGRWWNQSASRSAVYMDLEHSEFEIGRRYMHDGRVREERFASGTYNDAERHITLYYYYNRKNQDKLDTSENVPITDFDNSTLKLLKDGDVSPTAYKRLTEKNTDPFTRRLKGKWKNAYSDKPVFVFKRGTFYIFTSRHARHAYVFGNWSWSEPYLTLDFIVDLSVTGYPDKQRWFIKSISGNKLEVSKPSRDGTMVYNRIR